MEFKDLLPPTRRGSATAEKNLPDRPALDAMNDRKRYDENDENDENDDDDDDDDSDARIFD